MICTPFPSTRRRRQVSERISFVRDPGSGILVLLLNFSGFTDAADSLAHIASARELISRQPPCSLYILLDVTGSRFNTEIVDALRELASHNRPFVRASAVVGVSGVQKTVLEGVVAFTGRTNLKAFPDRNAGLRWLVQQ